MPSFFAVSRHLVGIEVDETKKVLVVKEVPAEPDKPFRINQEQPKPRNWQLAFGNLAPYTAPYSTMNDKCIQETYAPNQVCFGCGPANPKGLHIRSFPSGDEVVAEWQPAKEYEAFEGMLSGGIIGTLLDCHCNWTAAYHLMKRSRAAKPPCTVTAEYSIKLLRPTPTDQPIRLVARPVDISDERAIIEGELIAHDKVTATCRGTFVAVKPGHPAYHRW